MPLSALLCKNVFVPCYDQVCTRRFHWDVRTPLGPFCEGTVNPTCKRGVEKCCICGACSTKILVTVLSSAVRYNVLICYYGEACFTIISVVNVMDMLWNIGSGGGKRKNDDDGSTEECNNDFFIPPRLNYLQRHVKILLHSEGRHLSIQDLFLQGDHVNGLLTGVAAFVARMKIRKVAVLPAFVSEMLASNPNVDLLRYLQVYRSNFDILLAPVCEVSHWFLVVFYVDTKIVTSYDSMKSGPPLIFNALKRCVESVLHVQFAYEDKSDMVTLQQNGYDCGVNGFRMGEQICFNGENSLIEPFYAEAERARCREILRRLTVNEISDEWVPPVLNATDFVDLNKPFDTEAITVNDSVNDSEIEIIKIDKADDKNNDTVIKKQNEIEEKIKMLNHNHKI
uniref:Ubiquitin-like protease family profile domain-containing protein n=1 Tax=Panagrolaimus superbus TaxID=310955 RepID=A0A914YW53_9BILA